ncbi:lasso peptide biosynthesis B2 protein [Streptomyces apocyni]|uniref:lasso peptide biosynthesis B2 protein n=1 Tax=Streptomyces apocyni TaxID=2654677 RepID=UPI0012E9BA0D|nr:lasso peptide biosynthesis B2 protein [Streptomyces apocyni]
MTGLQIPKHVHVGDAFHGGQVLFDARSGQWYAMNGTARLLWEEWHRTGDFESAVRTLADGFPCVRYDSVRLDAERVARDLVERGLVYLDEERGSAHRDLPHGSTGLVSPDVSRTWDANTVRWPRTASLIGLLLALCLLRFPFRACVHAVTVLKERCGRRPATTRQAEVMLTAVRRAGERYPGRVACLEDSLATVLGLAVAGLAADWCLGSADDPYRFHAWVEVAGATVEPAEADDHTRFRRVLVL